MALIFFRDAAESGEDKRGCYIHTAPGRKNRTFVGQTIVEPAYSFCHCDDHESRTNPGLRRSGSEEEIRIQNSLSRHPMMARSCKSGGEIFRFSFKRRQWH